MRTKRLTIPKSKASLPKFPINKLYKKSNKDVRTISEEPILAKEDDFYLKLLEEKSRILTQLGSISMVWWTSAVVTCGGILFYAFTNRTQFIERFDGINWVFAGYWSFFLSIVVFGFYMARSAIRLKKDYVKIAIKLQRDVPNPSEYDIAKNGILIGTSTFILILIAWSVLWFKFIFIIP